jgi:hypothetical protein
MITQIIHCKEPNISHFRYNLKEDSRNQHGMANSAAPTYLNDGHGWALEDSLDSWKDVAAVMQD